MTPEHLYVRFLNCSRMPPRSEMHLRNRRMLLAAGPASPPLDSDEQVEAIDITASEHLPKWNYAIAPFPN